MGPYCFKWSTLITPFILMCNLASINRGFQAKLHDGPEFNLRCFCAPGTYERATVEIFATTDICSDNADHGASIKQTFNSSKMMVRMKICRPCWSGCLECIGPEDHQCITCAAGYLVEDKTGDESSSGDGPIDHSVEVVHCVSTCPKGYYVSSMNSSCYYCAGTNCDKDKPIETTDPSILAHKEEEVRSTPAGYYAIPPLIILGVGAVFLFAYLRKKRNRTTNSWKQDMVIRRGIGVESKSFLSTGPRPHQLYDYRVGNQYVIVDRPLPHHPLHRSHHGSFASSCWSAAENEDPDGVYETPESRKVHYLKSPGANRNQSKDHIKKPISRSLEDCRHHNTRQSDKHRHTKPRSGSLESNHPPPSTKKPLGHVIQRKSSDPMEAPDHHAPPTPVRHISNTPKRQLHNEHIYVNVDDST